MNIREALTFGQRQLRDAGIETPALDAQVLLSQVLGLSRERIYLGSEDILSPEHVSAYEELIDLRTSRIPVAYIVGKKEFYGVDFVITPDVLIPRPETEFVVEDVLAIIQSSEAPTVADLCCGSGIIGISVALNCPGAKVFAVDISQEAGHITAVNAKSLGVGDRVVPLIGDLWEPLDRRGIQGLDLIAANPPYIPSEDMQFLAPEVLREPGIALDGGRDGMEFYKSIIRGAPEHLKPRGSLVMELGYDQSDTITRMLKETGFTQIRMTEDLAGVHRVVSAIYDGSHGGTDLA